MGPCRVKRLQQFLGRAQRICRPGFGHRPHLSGVWAHVLWAPPRLPFTPVRLLKSMCVACMMARRQWSVVSLPRVVKRSPLVIYIDAAMDAGKYRLGLFSMDVGSRSVVPAGPPPNQQCAEAAALLWGLKLLLNVGVREAHLFGDNAAVLVQFLRCKAKVGRKFQQSVLKRFRYLWASCPGFTVYMHWVRGSHNPADPISRLCDNFNGDLGLAREMATRRWGISWPSPTGEQFFCRPWECLWDPLCCRSRGERACGPWGVVRGGQSSTRSFCSTAWRSRWVRWRDVVWCRCLLVALVFLVHVIMTRRRRNRHARSGKRRRGKSRSRKRSEEAVQRRTAR